MLTLKKSIELIFKLNQETGDKNNFLCVNAQGSENFRVLSFETAISSQSIS